MLILTLLRCILTSFFNPERWKLRRHHLGDRQSGEFRIYMKRFILQTPFGGVRLHKIMRSDLERHMHDHPFDFASLLLSGGYTEHTPKGAHYVKRWSINAKRAESVHRLEITRPVWTLFVHGPNRRAWGFQTEDGWIPWKRYAKAYSHNKLTF